MQTEDLYHLARKENIEVISFPMAENGSMSVLLEGGLCFIGMDASVQDGGIQERVHLSHELGHCVTGSFYNRYAAIDCRQRHENRADKWAIEQLITVDDLDLAKEALEKAGVKLLDVQHESSSLEQFYFNLVGGGNNA